jgi:hypothetical protein
VIGKNHLCAVGQKEAPGDVDPLGSHGVDLGEERFGVDDDPRADDAHPSADDARRKEMKREVAVLELDGMAGVVAAVIARDDIESIREQIDDLAFAFVAPLAAQHGDHSQRHEDVSHARMSKTVQDSRPGASIQSSR